MSSSSFVPSTLTMTANSMDEIYERLYNLYKTDYQIVDKQTETVPGILGLFQKSKVKVWYIVQEKTQEPEDFSKTKEKILKDSGVDMSKLAIKQYGEIASLLGEIKTQIVEVQNATSSSETHQSIKKIEKMLSANEFSHSFISYITDKLKSEFPIEKLEDFNLVQLKVVDWIGQSIKIEKPYFHKVPHIIVLVGPTGLGKTTTISKLAAKPILEAKHSGNPIPKVRLITIDHTRVGAEEQLKKFGTILNCQVDKAENAEDLNTIIQNCKNEMDYIFIDTSGYSPKDYDNIAKMRNILNLPGVSLDTHLVISASTKASDLENIIDNFSFFKFNSVIITKCDETSSYGNVLSVLYEKNKSISYITNGQKVPNDIKRASVQDFLYRLTDFRLDQIHIEDTFPEDD